MQARLDLQILSILPAQEFENRLLGPNILSIMLNATSGCAGAPLLTFAEGQVSCFSILHFRWRYALTSAEEVMRHRTPPANICFAPTA